MLLFTNWQVNKLRRFFEYLLVRPINMRNIGRNIFFVRPINTFIVDPNGQNWSYNECINFVNYIDCDIWITFQDVNLLNQLQIVQNNVTFDCYDKKMNLIRLVFIKFVTQIFDTNLVSNICFGRQNEWLALGPMLFQILSRKPPKDLLWYPPTRN